MNSQAIVESSLSSSEPRKRTSIWGSALLFLVLYYSSVGFLPFSSSEFIETGNGNTINQIVWLAFSAVAVVVSVNNASLSRQLFKRSWPILLVAAWFFISVLWTPHPDLTIRRSGLLTLIMLVGFGVAVTTPRPLQFFRTLLLVSGVIIVVDLISLVAVPGLAIGEDGGATGVHSHKNTAGQLALFAFLTWFVAALMLQDLRSRTFALVVCLVSFGFLILTQSKTSTAIGVVAPMGILLALPILYSRGLIRIALLSTLIGLAALLWAFALGIGLTVDEFFLLVVRDTTFTGRTDVWEFLSSEVALRPWKGFGYGAFWHTGLRLSPVDLADGFTAVAGQAHNGYLDLVVESGYVGLGLAIIPIVRSLYLAVSLGLRGDVERAEYGAYMLSPVLLVAILLLNFMESSYFRPNHYMSIMFVTLYFMIERWALEIRSRPQRVQQ